MEGKEDPRSLESGVIKEGEFSEMRAASDIRNNRLRALEMRQKDGVYPHEESDRSVVKLWLVVLTTQINRWDLAGFVDVIDDGPVTIIAKDSIVMGVGAVVIGSRHGEWEDKTSGHHEDKEDGLSGCEFSIYGRQEEITDDEDLIKNEGNNEDDARGFAIETDLFIHPLLVDEKEIDRVHQ